MTSNTPSISIIIPTKDRTDLLKECLASLENYMRYDLNHYVAIGATNRQFARSDLEYEVIVITTGDVPDDVDVWAHRPGATFAQAVNVGAKAARGDFIWLLNDDVFVTSNPWEGKSLRNDAIIGARLLYPSGLVQHAGVGFDLGSAPYNLWRLAPREHPEVVQPRRYPAVTFACALIPRHIWEELGGLDENYINCWEDIDFCLRAGEAGYTVWYDPSITAIHLESQTAGRKDNEAVSWQHWRETWVKSGRIHKALGVWPFELAS